MIADRDLPVQKTIANNSTPKVSNCVAVPGARRLKSRNSFNSHTIKFGHNSAQLTRIKCQGKLNYEPDPPLKLAPVPQENSSICIMLKPISKLSFVAIVSLCGACSE
jgi:hypothetical protein